MNTLRARLRIWWMTHRQQLWPTIGILVVFVLHTLVVKWDREAAVEAEKAALHRAVAEHEKCAVQRDAVGFRKTVFIIEAATPQEAANKLASVSGSADLQRYRLMYTK